MPLATKPLLPRRGEENGAPVDSVLVPTGLLFGAFLALRNKPENQPGVFACELLDCSFLGGVNDIVITAIGDNDD